MTNFHRDFLVPYLETLCTLHLLKRKISSKYNKALRDKQDNDNLMKKVIPIPKEPRLEETTSCGVLAALIYGIFSSIVCLIGIILMLIENNDKALNIIIFTFIGSVIIFVIFPSSLIRSAKKTNEGLLTEYNAAVYNVEQRNLSNHETARKRKPEIENRLSSWESELNKVSRVLDAMYSVNIIPRHYRDIYAAVYLYDWFSTGKSTDLDHALSMFVLEEIKSKLDTIIRKLDDVLINQNTIIGNQERGLKQQQEHHNQLMNKLDSIQATEEERNNYLEIIARNSEAAAYFAAADYVKKL